MKSAALLGQLQRIRESGDELDRALRRFAARDEWDDELTAPVLEEEPPTPIDNTARPPRHVFNRNWAWWKRRR